MKTPLKEAIEGIKFLHEKTENSNPVAKIAYGMAITVCEQQFKKEKQAIIDAYNEDLYGGLSGRRKYENGEQYYNNTFKKD